MSQTATPCEHCPQAGKVHVDANPSMYLMCVLNIPGQTPTIITTPRYTRDAADDGGLGAGFVLDQLIRTAVRDGSTEVEKFLREKFQIPPQEAVTTIWGDIPESEPGHGAGAAVQSGQNCGHS